MIIAKKNNSNGAKSTAIVNVLAQRRKGSGK